MEIEASELAFKKAMFQGWLDRSYSATGKSPTTVLKDMLYTAIKTPFGTTTPLEAMLASYVGKAMDGDTKAADRLLGIVDDTFKPEQSQLAAPTQQASIAFQPAVNLILQQAGYKQPENVDLIQHKTLLEQQLGL